MEFLWLLEQGINCQILMWKIGEKRFTLAQYALKGLNFKELEERLTVKFFI